VPPGWPVDGFGRASVTVARVLRRVGACVLRTFTGWSGYGFGSFFQASRRVNGGEGWDKGRREGPRRSRAICRLDAAQLRFGWRLENRWCWFSVFTRPPPSPALSRDDDVDLLLRVLGAGNVSREMRAAFQDRLFVLLGSRP
jgi:hypothetical protein